MLVRLLSRHMREVSIGMRREEAGQTVFAWKQHAWGGPPQVQMNDSIQLPLSRHLCL